MTIRKILSFLLMALFLAPLMLAAQKNQKSRYYHLLVGTYTSGSSEGINVYRFDSKTGKLSHVYTEAGVKNPSFVTLSPDARYAYAVNELGGEEHGMVSAFRFHKESGTLEFLNQKPSKGDHPCYLSMDEKGKHLFVGNYTGGNLSVLPVKADGSLGEPIQKIDHEGSSVNQARQEKAHVHSTVFSPEERHLFVGDLGIDQIKVYAYDRQASKPLQEMKDCHQEVKSGSGPRHLIFDEDGKYAYLVLELTAEVSVFRHDKGKLENIQIISMTAPDFEGEVSGAEIRISPDGKFLYASNRGDANEIAIYAIDQQKGTLKMLGRQSSMGETPRNFMIDPSGRYLLAANQDSNSIIVFERNQRSGMLSPTGTKVEVGKPVYLLMTPAK
jgi:6-phosphogluconolactonase